MFLLNNDVLSIITEYTDDRESYILCDVMNYDVKKYIIKNIVDITTYKPSDGTISKVYWDPLLNILPHTFHVVCRLDDYFKASDGSYHEVQIDKYAKVYNNTIEYRNKNGKLHRIGGPAVVWDDGDKWWYENGKRHRVGGPAVETYNNHKEWHENDKLHRINGPAIEYDNGDKKWYQNGKLHRIGGPAIEYADGDKYWYENGKLHRINGPAVEYADGDKEWYENGKLTCSISSNKRI